MCCAGVSETKEGVCSTCQELRDDLEEMGSFRMMPEIDDELDEFGNVVKPATGNPRCAVCQQPADPMPYIVGRRNGDRFWYVSMFFCSPTHAQEPPIM